MEYTGKVVAKIQQEGGPSACFARIQVGSKKSGNAAKLRFFDVPDQGELVLGDKLVITITRVPKPAVVKVIPIDGCKFHSAPEDWSQCCICNPTSKFEHYCADHIPQPTPGGCVSVPDFPASGVESESERMQAELEPLVKQGYKCGGCGADLSKHPTSASAHVCPAHFGRVPEGDLANPNKRFCV